MLGESGRINPQTGNDEASSTQFSKVPLQARSGYSGYGSQLAPCSPVSRQRAENLDAPGMRERGAEAEDGFDRSGLAPEGQPQRVGQCMTMVGARGADPVLHRPSDAASRKQPLALPALVEPDWPL